MALGKQGHSLVCDLTWLQLDTGERQQLQALLQFIPDTEQRRIKRYINKPHTNPLSFADACNWADAIKDDKRFAHYKPWHYVNVDREVTQIVQDLCRADTPCITYAITQHVKQLWHSDSGHDKWQPLLFISHWVGDIHQPLHIGFQSDKGGNLISTVHPDQGCDNLHAIWDRCLLYGQHYRHWLGLLSARLDVLSKQPLVTHSSNQTLDANVATWPVHLWATETLAITRHPKTHYCSLVEQRCSLIHTPLKISPDYVKYNQNILLEQILKASVRLKIIIKNLL